MRNTAKAEHRREALLSADGPLSADSPRFAGKLDDRVADMRIMLLAMRPASTSTALKALRDAFPDTALSDRLRALRSTAH